MAHDFYARIMHQTDDEVNYRNFPKHQLFAILNEMARDIISIDRVKEKLKIDSGDDLFNSYVCYIMYPLSIPDRLDRVKILEDIHIIHEYNRDNLPIRDLYPTKDSLRQRIGI
jgi:hypothetical protein